MVTGPSETKQLSDLLPGILNQLGPESMDKLRKIAEKLGASNAGAGVQQSPTIDEDDEEDDDDDDVPDLVENFEEAAAK